MKINDRIALYFTYMDVFSWVLAEKLLSFFTAKNSGISYHIIHFVQYVNRGTLFYVFSWRSKETLFLQ